jgi:O-antigen ligase
MANNYNVSTDALLKRIGLSPGKKGLVFFISLAAITIPMLHVYNSFAVICFVLFSLLSARWQDFKLTPALALPMLLYALMLASLAWTPDVKISATALGKEAPLLFIPFAFCFIHRLTYRSVNAILKSYSIAMCLFGIYLVVRALVRYFTEGNINVFFYNELASDKISIYLAIFFSLALFVFLAKERKTFWGYLATLFLLTLVLLLSKRTIIFTDIAIITLYYLFYSGLKKRLRLFLIAGFCVAGAAFIVLGNFSESFPTGLLSKQKPQSNVHMVTLTEAWERDTFSKNDFFSGPAFRVYRARVLNNLSAEGTFFFTGAGINTSDRKVTQVAQKDNTLYNGWEGVPYNRLNFHNQYMEAYADLGFLGLTLIVLLVLYNLKKGLQNKYFIHIAFAILMISLFLTESFLWRQKGVVFFTLFYCLFNSLKTGPVNKQELIAQSRL